MPPIVCRLKYRKGKPLGLSIYPGLTLLSLPLEIRNKIYSQLLVTQERITVWSAPSLVPSEALGSQNPKLPSLTLSLLRVNKTISLEAAAIFYYSNTFLFTGPETWDPLYSFLLIIGAKNRGHLKHIEAGISKPIQLKSHPDGTLTIRASDTHWTCTVFPRDIYSRSYPPEVGSVYGELEVDYVSPAIEAVFRILGPSKTTLRLDLIMEPGFLPGVQLAIDDYVPDSNRWSLEIPDHVERMRREFTAASGGDNKVEVVWKGSGSRDYFDREVGHIRKIGWEILEVEERYRQPERWGPLILFTLRRQGAVVSG